MSEEYITDEYGKWRVIQNGKVLVEPSQKWYDENPIPPEPEPQPSEIDLINERFDVLEAATTELEALEVERMMNEYNS